MWRSVAASQVRLAALAVATLPVVVAAGDARAEDGKSICQSDVVSAGGSLTGAGTAAWLIARSRLGPVGATVGSLASEKLGSALAPAICNFLRDQLADEAKAANPAGPMPWSAPPARLPFGRPSDFPSRLARPPGLVVDAPSRPVSPADAAMRRNLELSQALEAALRSNRLMTTPLFQPHQGQPYLGQPYLGLRGLGAPGASGASGSSALGRWLAEPTPLPPGATRSAIDGVMLDSKPPESGSPGRPR